MVAHRWLGAALLVTAACQDRAATARAHMQRSLLRLAAAQSAFYARHGTYTSFVDSLRLGNRPYRPDDDVRLVIARADTAGWRAIASNMWTDEICRLARGAPGRAVTDQGPECQP